MPGNHDEVNTAQQNASSAKPSLNEGQRCKHGRDCTFTEQASEWSDGQHSSDPIIFLTPHYRQNTGAELIQAPQNQKRKILNFINSVTNFNFFRDGRIQTTNHSRNWSNFARGELSPFAVLGIDTCEVGGLGSTGSLGRLAMGGRSSTSWRRFSFFARCSLAWTVRHPPSASRRQSSSFNKRQNKSSKLNVHFNQLWSLHWVTSSYQVSFSLN